MAEEKQEKKKISKAGRIFAGIFAFIVLLIAINSGSNSTTTQTRSTTQIEKTDPVQERINRINELYAEESTFEKVEVIGNNSIAIVFNETPDLGIADSIDSITRGQAMNLSEEVNGVASVKTYVGGTAQMFCTATKGTVNDCSDYR